MVKPSSSPTTLTPPRVRRRWPFALLFGSVIIGYAAPIYSGYRSQQILERTKIQAELAGEGTDRADVLVAGIDRALSSVFYGLAATTALWVLAIASVGLILWDIWMTRPRRKSGGG
jgi:hypothetical protein